MSSRRRTQEAITRRAAVLLLCVRVRRRGGNENEHELVDEGIIKELSFLQRARALQLRACSFSSIPSSIIYPRGYRPFLSSSARPLSSAPLAPLLRARHARSSSNARTRSRARTAVQAGVRANSRSNVWRALPRGHRSLLEGTFIGLSRRVLVRIAPYFGSSRRHRRRRRRCTRAAA